MRDPKDQQKRMIAEAVRMLGEEYESNEGFNEYFDGEEPLAIKSPRKRSTLINTNGGRFCFG
jgi:hypothetical protein